MVKHILIARQTSCNKINKKTNNKIFAEKSNNCPASTKTGMIIDEVNNKNNKNPYLNFHSARKIIHRFLNCNRVIFLPHIVPKFTEAELAKKLNITTIQLRHLQKSSRFYKGIAKHICLSLVNLYCNTKFQRPESMHEQEVCHE